MSAPHHQTFGGKASDGAGLVARTHSLRAGEIIQSIRAGARELVIALAVSMSCAVTIALVVVGVRLWKALNF